MHLYLQLTRSLAVTLIWLYCNKLVLRYVRLRVSDLGQVSIPPPGIVTLCINLYGMFNINTNPYVVYITPQCWYHNQTPITATPNSHPSTQFITLWYGMVW